MMACVSPVAMEIASPKDRTNRHPHTQGHSSFHDHDKLQSRPHSPLAKEMRGEHARPGELQSPRAILAQQQSQQHQVNETNGSTPSNDPSAAVAPLSLNDNPLSPTMRDTQEGEEEANHQQADREAAFSPGGDARMKQEDSPQPPANHQQTQRFPQSNGVTTAPSITQPSAPAAETLAIPESDDDSDDESGHAKHEPDEKMISHFGNGSDLTPIQQHHLQQKFKKEKGVSCHQCKTSKDNDVLLFCVNKAEKGRRKRNCRKKYCDACLRRAYNLSIENFTQEEIDNWQCPACQGKCVCAACSRKHDLAMQAHHRMAMQQAAAQAAAQFMPFGMLHQMRSPNLHPNMHMLHQMHMAMNLTPEQRAGLVQPALATPVPPNASPTAPPGSVHAVTPAIVPAVVVPPETPQGSPGATQPSGNGSVADPHTPLVPIPINPAVVPAIATAANVPVLQPMVVAAATPVPAVPLVAHPPQTNVVVAAVAVDSLGRGRPRAYSCPGSPTHANAATQGMMDYPHRHPNAGPTSNNRPTNLPHPYSAQQPHRQLPRLSSEAVAGMPQRHRRNSLKVNPFPKHKAHGALAYQHQQMQHSHPQESNHSHQQSHPQQHQHARNHSSSSMSSGSSGSQHHHHDAHSELLLPASFAQGMSLSSSGGGGGQDHSNHHHQESLYLHSAPVSPTHRSMNGHGHGHGKQSRYHPALAQAVECAGPVLAAIDLSIQGNSGHSSPQLSPNPAGDSSMMLISPLHTGSPMYQQGNSHHGHGGLSLLHSPPNQLQGMMISPHQQSAFSSTQFQVSPQVSPQTMQLQQNSLLSSYLQQQQHHPIYTHSPGGDLHTPDMDLSLHHHTHTDHHTDHNPNGLDSSSVLTQDECHRMNLHNVVGNDGETLNLHLNLDDPTATLQTINQLQVTLQSVINSKTAQAQAQQNLHMQHMAQHQQPHQSQHHNQGGHHRMQLSSHHNDGTSLDLVPFDSNTDPLGLDTFTGSTSDPFMDGYGSNPVSASGNTNGSPTFAFSSSHGLFGSNSSPHNSSLKHPNRSNTNTPSFLNNSPNNSPRHSFVSASMASTATTTMNSVSAFGMSPGNFTGSSPSSTPFPSSLSTPNSNMMQEQFARSRLGFGRNDSQRSQDSQSGVHHLLRTPVHNPNGDDLPASPIETLEQHRHRSALDFASSTLS